MRPSPGLPTIVLYLLAPNCGGLLTSVRTLVQEN